MPRKITARILLATALISLTACGYSPGHRALTGAAIGAGGGAVIGAVTGIGPGTGALIGGATGAAVGGLTTHNQLNLDDH
jgi:hypothetical protein